MPFNRGAQVLWECGRKHNWFRGSKETITEQKAFGQVLKERQEFPKWSVSIKVEIRMKKSTSKCGASCYFFSLQMRQESRGRQVSGRLFSKVQTSQLGSVTSRNFRTAESGWWSHEGRTCWGSRILANTFMEMKRWTHGHVFQTVRRHDFRRRS